MIQCCPVFSLPHPEPFCLLHGVRSRRWGLQALSDDTVVEVLSFCEVKLLKLVETLKLTDEEGNFTSTDDTKMPTISSEQVELV